MKNIINIYKIYLHTYTRELCKVIIFFSVIGHKLIVDVISVFFYCFFIFVLSKNLSRCCALPGEVTPNFPSERLSPESSCLLWLLFMVSHGSINKHPREIPL